jgi:hypothetical protein
VFTYKSCTSGVGRGEELGGPGGAGFPGACLKMLDKEAGAAAGAAAVHAKKNLTGIRSNNKKIKSQDGTCDGSLQKTKSKKFSLKLDSFGKKAPGGDW